MMPSRPVTECRLGNEPPSKRSTWAGPGQTRPGPVRSGQVRSYQPPPGQQAGQSKYERGYMLCGSGHASRGHVHQGLDTVCPTARRLTRSSSYSTYIHPTYVGSVRLAALGLGLGQGGRPASLQPATSFPHNAIRLLREDKQETLAHSIALKYVASWESCGGPLLAYARPGTRYETNKRLFGRFSHLPSMMHVQGCWRLPRYFAGAGLFRIFPNSDITSL
jgi:hypothetical protein